MKILLTTYLFFACSITFGQARLKTEEVLELDSKEGFVHEAIYPVGKRGFFLLTKQIQGKNQELSYYSTDLDRLITIPLVKKVATTDLGIITDKDSVVFSWVESSFYTWIIKEFNTKTLAFEQKEYTKKSQYFTPSTSMFFNGKIVINGSVNNRAKILVLDPQTGKQESLELPGSHPKGVRASLSVDHEYNRLSILYRTEKSLRKDALSLVFVNGQWKLSEPFTLNGNPGRTALDGKVMWTGENSFVLAGTFVTDPFRSMKASGFYFSKWENGSQQLIKYYFFSGLSEYANYLLPDRQKKIDVISNDRAEMDYSESNISFHPVYENGKGFRLVGEAYNLEFKRTTDSVSNRDLIDWTLWLLTDSPLPEKEQIARTVETFEGFRFSHAVVLDLDESGNKTGDYCFALKTNMLMKKLKPVLHVDTNPEGRMEMRYIQQKGGVCVSEIVGDSLQTSFKNGLSENSDFMGQRVDDIYCIPWYGEEYLVYGIKILPSKPDFVKGGTEIPTIFFVKRITLK